MAEPDDSIVSLAIVAVGFICKAEEAKEHKGANHRSSASHLHPDYSVAIHAPEDRGELVDLGVVEVRVRPADPGLDLGKGEVDPQTIRGDGDGAAKLCSSECHEAEVTVRRQSNVERKVFAKLHSASEELAKSKNYIEGSATAR